MGSSGWPISSTDIAGDTTATPQCFALRSANNTFLWLVDQGFARLAKPHVAHRVAYLTSILLAVIADAACAEAVCQWLIDHATVFAATVTVIFLTVCTAHLLGQPFYDEAHGHHQEENESSEDTEKEV